jgi:hypothetical protein
VNAEVEFLLREGLKRRGLSAIAENVSTVRTAARGKPQT